MQHMNLPDSFLSSIFAFSWKPERMATLQAGPLRARRDATAKRTYPLRPDIPDM